MTPVNYFAEAAALMAKVKEIDNPSLPLSRDLVQQAQAYAAMASVPREVAIAAARYLELRDTVTKQTNGAVL